MISRTSVASRMKFFVTTVSDWESLAAVTKKSVLVPGGVLDPPLLEIEMGIEVVLILYTRLSYHRCFLNEIFSNVRRGYTVKYFFQTIL